MLTPACCSSCIAQTYVRTRRLNLTLSSRMTKEGRVPNVKAKMARGPEDWAGIGFGMDRRLGREVVA